MNILPSQQLSENECLEVYITEIPKIYKCYKSLPNKNYIKNQKIKELNDEFLSILNLFSNQCKHGCMHAYSCLFDEGFEIISEKKCIYDSNCC
jgi:hypothetical protein